MNIDRAVFALSGFVVLGSLALGQLHSSNWLYLTAFAGLNMVQAAFTGFCPAATVFKHLGIGQGCAFK